MGNGSAASDPRPTLRSAQDGSGFGGHAALESEKNEVRAAAHAEFVEEIGDVELYGAFGDVELAGDFLVREVLEKRIEDFLFATAQIGNRVGFEATRLAGQDGVHETRENGAWNPEAAGRNQGQSADQLVAGFGIGEDAFYTKTKQREAGGVLMLFTDNDEASFGMTFENIGKQRAGGLASGMRVNDIDLSFGRFKRAKVGSKSGLELFRDDFEIRPGQKAFELAQHEWMR